MDDNLPGSKVLQPGATAERTLSVLVALTSLFVALLFLITALRRLHYPYELEELEGNVFMAAQRVFHGQSVYVRPSMNFIPYMYPPGFYYATAVVGKVMGMSMAALRMTSILSTLGCFAVIALLVWTETRSWLSALAGMGLYAGCYTVCQAWFDLGRLDSLFVLLVLVAMYATRRLHPVLAALVWVMAFQTKQSILPAACLMLLSSWPDRKRTLMGLGTLLAVAAGSVWWLNRVTSGWYNFYVFQVPAANADIKARTLALFLPIDVFRPLSLALLVIAAAAICTAPSLKNRATRFYLLACSLIPLFWWIRAHGGSTMNAVMPIYALLAVLFGIAVARLLEFARHLDPAARRPATLILLLATLVQLSAGLYNPGDYVPTNITSGALAQVVSRIETMPGSVYVAQHPYYAQLAGKLPQADLVGIHDALRVKRPEVHDALQHELQEALEQHRYTAIVTESQASTAMMDELLNRHENWAELYPTQMAFPMLPPQTLPDWIMAPCPSLADAAQACAPNQR